MRAEFPTPVIARDLKPGQLNGLACCWCADPLTQREQRDPPIGQIADGTPLFGCRSCRNQGRRLPVFPEFGSI